MAYKVVLTASFAPTPQEEEIAGRIGAKLVSAPSRTEDEIIANCREADAVLTGPNEPFTRRVIEALEKCKVISRLGIGYDNIDIAAATEKGIAVSVVPDYAIEEVSDHAMAFILALSRKLIPLRQAVRAGLWKAGRTETTQIARPIRRLKTQTLGIIGAGRIGQALARKAQAFGLTVIAHDPYLSQAQAEKLGIKLVTLDNLLKESDYISVHAPLTKETRHLLNLETLSKMKPTAYVINNARGGLIDESALYTALTRGLIAGAGIDVTDPEPPDVNNPLLQLDNIIVTPHSSWYSQESLAELRREGIEAVVQVLQGGWPRVLANPEVKGRK
ncbi:MAG: C-terminal binding protein [Chloroflexi bacterium]|nr:C-terminal binding protein [Chloroflexota bacterium]